MAAQPGEKDTSAAHHTPLPVLDGCIIILVCHAAGKGAQTCLADVYPNKVCKQQKLMIRYNQQQELSMRNLSYNMTPQALKHDTPGTRMPYKCYTRTCIALQQRRHIWFRYKHWSHAQMTSKHVSRLIKAQPGVPWCNQQESMVRPCTTCHQLGETTQKHRQAPEQHHSHAFLPPPCRCASASTLLLLPAVTENHGNRCRTG